MGQLSQGSGRSGNAVRMTAALFETLMSESSFGSVYSHMSLLESSCGKSDTVIQIRLGEGEGGDTIGRGGGVGEPRTGIIYAWLSTL